MMKAFLFKIIFILTFYKVNGHNWHTTEDDNKFYIETEMKYNWFEAFAECNRLKMSLMAVDSKHKQELLKEVTESIADEPKLWLGGHDNAVSRRFEWISTGETFRYSNWHKNEPNNNAENCVMTFDRTLQWNDAPCSTKLGFVCEANPMLLEKAAELKTLKDVLESEIKILTEQSGNLTKSLETQLQEKETELIMLRASLQIQGEEIKQMKKNLDQSAFVVSDIPTLYETSSHDPIEDVNAENVPVISYKDVRASNVLPDKVENCEDVSHAVNAALLKVANEDLLNQKKANELLAKQYFAVIMKSYEAFANRK
uniref:C-type lectin domain-containing protein n=1 Tax=Stomoxys calcitrans TaxID=35570 RepID=A0A1I8PKR8_STOCA